MRTNIAQLNIGIHGQLFESQPLPYIFHHKPCPIFDIALWWFSALQIDLGIVATNEKQRLGRMHRYCRAACFEVDVQGCPS